MGDENARLTVYGGGASELRIEHKLITIQMDVEFRGGSVVIIERNRLRSYTMKIDLGGVSWAIQALRQVWGQCSDKPFFSKYTSSLAVFWIQKVCNKNGVFAEISKWEAGVNRNNIIIPAGVDGHGWEAMAEMLERVIYGDSRATTDEKEIRTIDKGGYYRSNHAVFSTYRRNTNGNRAVFWIQKVCNKNGVFAEMG
ncbi:transcription factor Pur-alpha 1-like [Camellia sinensis]|uniref:transcription factor Pur-alpha 1-like n=1 Tax=Camellia sinensis TaxID=4442 RepID=UPI001035C141|nr:transcription factor Pur-alpha 1-like [Camellia sinensis]